MNAQAGENEARNAAAPLIRATPRRRGSIANTSLGGIQFTRRTCSGTVITSRHASIRPAPLRQAEYDSRSKAVLTGCFDSQHPHPRLHPTKPARRSPAGGCKSSKATAYGQPAFQFTVVRRISGLGKSITPPSLFSRLNLKSRPSNSFIVDPSLATSTFN